MKKDNDLGYAINGCFIARAILKDYSKVISHIENCTAKEVEDRIIKIANEIKERLLDKNV